jgi:hypothetical protein
VNPLKNPTLNGVGFLLTLPVMLYNDGMSDETTILNWYKDFKKGSLPDTSHFPLKDLESISENGRCGIYKKDGKRLYFWIQTDQWVNDHTVPLSTPEVYLSEV